MPSQVIMQLQGTAPPKFEALENVANLPSRSFEDRERGRRAPHFATKDLLSLADFALRTVVERDGFPEGYRVESLELEDLAGARLDQSEEDVLSAELIRRLTEVGLVKATRWLTHQHPTLAVVGLRMLSPDFQLIILRRRGASEIEGQDEALAFLALAWNELHFA